MKIKRFLSVLLAAAIVLSTMSFTAFAEDMEYAPIPLEENDTEAIMAYSLTANTDWYNDEETSFKISTADELAGLAQLVNSGNNFSKKTITLTADIDLNNEEWTPIGTSSNSFKGTFDGGNNTIKNLTITKEFVNTRNNCYVGLFGRTDSPAVIKNITVENVDITASLYVGAIVGLGYTGSISNCHVKGDIAIDAWWYAGAIGGNGYMNPIEDCTAIGNDGSYVAGNDGSYIGGIWGFNGEGATKVISGCKVENLTITGVDRVGGITGIVHQGNTITNCTVENVTVSASDAECTSVGLIAGANNGTASRPTQIINNEVTESEADIAGTPVTSSTGGTSNNGVTQATIVGTDIEIDDETGKITSGTFEVEPPASALDDDLTISKDESGNLIVVEANQISIGEAPYSTLNEAISAAADGDTIVLSAGDYEITSGIANKNITIKGEYNTVIEVLKAVGAAGSTINFVDATIVFDNDGYEGFQHSSKVTYTNCTHIGTEFLYAAEVAYTGCTFEMYDEKTEYAVWTYSAKDVTFTDCVFNTNGKAVLVFHEGAHEAEINVSGCEFNSNGTYTGKAAIELGQSAYGNTATYSLVIENSTADENFSANNSTSSLWGNKDSIEFSEEDSDGIGITIDNAPCVPLIKLNDAPYSSLDNALEDAEDGDTITLMGDAKLSKNHYLDSITINLNNNTLKMGDGVTNHGGWMISSNSQVTFENGTIDLNGIKASEAVFIQRGEGQSKTVFNNIDFVGDVEYVNYVFSPQDGSMELKDCSITLTTDDAYNYVFAASTTVGKFVFNNTDVNVSGFRKAFLNSTLDITGGEILITNSKNGMDNVKGEISGTQVTIEDSTEYGIGGEGEEYVLVLKDGAVVEVKNSTEYDISLTGGATINIYDSESALIYDTEYVDEASKINEPRAFVLKIGGEKADTEDKAVAVNAGDVVEIELYIESDEGIKGADWEITYEADKFEYIANPKANGVISDNDYQQGTGVYDKNVAVRTYKFKALSLDEEEIGKFDVVGYLNSSAGEALEGNIVESEIIPAYVKVALDKNYGVVVKIDDEIVEKDDEDNYVKEYKYDGTNHIVKIIPEFATPDLVAEEVTYKVNGETVATLEGYDFSNEGDYVIEYVVDGPDGYGNIEGTVILKITAPDYVVEVNLNNETIADYVKEDVEAGTMAKKLVLVYTNVDNVSFTYDEKPMLDVTANGYKYVNHSANNGSGTIPVEYKHVFAYVTDVIDGGDIKSYEDKVKHASGDKYTQPEVVTYDDCNINYQNGVEGQDIITGYLVYNNIAEAFSAQKYMKMVLKSDLNGDKYVNVKDTSAIINAVYPQN